MQFSLPTFHTLEPKYLKCSRKQKLTRNINSEYCPIILANKVHITQIQVFLLFKVLKAKITFVKIIAFSTSLIGLKEIHHSHS